MSAGTYKYPCKFYNTSSPLGPLASISFRSTSLLKDLDKLFETLVLFGHSIFAPDVFFKTLFIAKYIKKAYNVFSR